MWITICNFYSSAAVFRNIRKLMVLKCQTPAKDLHDSRPIIFTKIVDAYGKRKKLLLADNAGGHRPFKL